jgi:outer membrane protein insertion porin family
MLFTKDSSSVLKWLPALALIMLLAATVAAFAQAKPIVEIKFVGNDHISAEAMASAIALKTGAEFSETAVEEAKKSIEGMGFFQPGVIAATETVTGGVRLIFTVVENPVVKDIQISGNTVVTTEKLMGMIRTVAGGVLNTDTLLQKDVRAIEGYYEELGYIAYVTENIGIDPKTGVLSIPINEVRIEQIKIVGTKKTKNYVILREMKQKAGDVYNVKAMHLDLQRIYDLDIFEIESASSYKTEPGSDLGKVNIVIPVKEKKTGEVSLGLGYSSRNKLVGQAKLTENNFRGHAQKVNLLWEQSGTRGASGEIGFFEPWLDSKNTSLGVNIYNKLSYRFSNNSLPTGGNSNDFDERRQGGSITISRPLNPMNRAFLTMRTESIDAGKLEGVLLESQYNLGQGARVTSGTLRMANDNRDSQLDPFMGGYNSASVEFGTASFDDWGWTTGPIDMQSTKQDGAFSKYNLELRKYLSKGGARKDFNERRRRLALRVMAGGLTGDVPFSEQYFMGGAETLRGYREDRFWGKYMMLASAEYRVPLAPSLTGVLFADYGDAWGAPEHYRVTPKETKVETLPSTDPPTYHQEFVPGPGGDPVLVPLIKDLTQHTGFKGNLGYGIGIRVNTPLGPLRLDYGFGDEGSRAHFSIGHVF